MKIRSYEWGYAWLHIQTEDFKDYMVYIEETKFSYIELPPAAPPRRKEFPYDCQTLEQKKEYLQMLLKIGALQDILEGV
ncbi:hypothetical protein [uncultured Parasutterella sp.]|uniref:hypothetical protein n=1 Tax=uncultured Parasutterella sp. TaxID=1263098 RepID=UPI002068376D|nr:hypothetical protein [uncultured Parasutterella sp.]DAJ56235.1 MAG TPA: hypothetical protein [Caudoviricetes sp.]